jgi:hypothetical protein
LVTKDEGAETVTNFFTMITNKKDFQKNGKLGVL